AEVRAVSRERSDPSRAYLLFFFSSRRRHTRWPRDWSSDVCSSDLYIGQNWSGTVTIKVGHTLIRTGPYRWVRHPIYSGILLAMIGTALARGKPISVLAIVLFWFGFWFKSRLEEQFMRKTFGQEYDEYARSTGALVPKL